MSDSPERGLLPPPFFRVGNREPKTLARYYLVTKRGSADSISKVKQGVDLNMY